MRDRVLKHMMIRRTRSEIEQCNAEDMDKQGLSFPEVQPPRRILHAFDDAPETVFNRTIDWIADFTYARYTPLLFYEGDLDALREQFQRNIGGFMKSILLKRLESSFHAFKRTLARFIHSYERFIEMDESGTVYLGRDVDVFDLLDNDRDERLHELIEDPTDLRHVVLDVKLLFDDLSDSLSSPPRPEIRSALGLSQGVQEALRYAASQRVLADGPALEMS